MVQQLLMAAQYLPSAAAATDGTAAGLAQQVAARHQQATPATTPLNIFNHPFGASEELAEIRPTGRVNYPPRRTLCGPGAT